MNRKRYRATDKDRSTAIEGDRERETQRERERDETRYRHLGTHNFPVIGNHMRSPIQSLHIYKLFPIIMCEINGTPSPPTSPPLNPEPSGLA